MKKYHKIQTVYKRNPGTNFKTLLYGEFSIPEFQYLQDNIWIFTEKVDGTNIRIMFDGNSIIFGGKTDKAQLPTNLLNHLNKQFYDKVSLFQEIFERSNEVCLYGEGYGAGIQKGGKYRQDQNFVLFDIKIEEWWLQREDIEEIAKKLNIRCVPVIGHGTLSKMIELTKNGFDSEWGNFIAEGIVARPAVELKARNGQRIITKIKHKDFVLK